MIELRFCRVEYTPQGATTWFADGTSVDATPHDTHHYHIIAHRCGYQDDILSYCREHEVCHSIVAEWWSDSVSDVLWQLAHGKEANRWHMIAEEMAAQTLQRFVRARERPIISGCDWDGLRAYAVTKLDMLGVPFHD